MMNELEREVAKNKLVEIEQQIHQLVEHQKALENDIKLKREL
jgi:hypothetical protein